MFDQIPIRVWLLIAIAVFAFTPAQYVFRHVSKSPHLRDITQPPADFSWRSTGQLVRSLTILAALMALAVFIFTPTAERFAASPRFWPILLAVFGAWALFMVLQGFVTGRIEPLVRGLYDTYERETHTFRYWASMVWNAALASLMLWTAYQTNQDASAQVAANKCAYEADNLILQQKLSACAELIRLRPDDADAYMHRGLIFLAIAAFDQAVSDFTYAHELDPRDPWPLANRGLAFAWGNDPARAQKDFDAVRSVDPSNPVMLRGEALLRKNAGDMEGAVERLTESMVRDPDNLWALRTRAEIYWELGEQEKSREDDQKWLQLTKAARTTRY